MNQILPDEEVFCDCGCQEEIEELINQREQNYWPAPIWANNTAFFVAGLMWGWLITIAFNMVKL